MKKFIFAIALTLLLLVGVWYLRQNPPTLESSPSPSASVSPTPMSQTISTPEITFTSPSDFGVAVKPEQILVTAYIPPCDTDNMDYCLYYADDVYKGTNFESAGLRIQKRTTLSTERLCTQTPPVGYASTTKPSATHVETEYATSFFTSVGDAAAGHYTSGSLYRLFVKASSTCYEFETRIGESQFANYPEGSIKQFTATDRATVQAKLKDIVNTVTITATGVHPIWPVPVSSRTDYVRTQLASLSGSFNTLLTDSRLAVYPKQTVVYKPPDWQAVKNKLYSAESVQKGADYIRANLSTFENAEQTYGVPKEALTGLIAMETDFGKNAGNYSVFNALYSRMMQWPEATWKAQADQLVAFTKYCVGSHVDCFSVKGSYAGAFGLVQFMPDSLLSYGVDGDGNGVINLSLPVDAIPSAAHYLQAHGWAANPQLALTRYYGSPEGYPEIVLAYAELLKT